MKTKLQIRHKLMLLTSMLAAAISGNGISDTSTPSQDPIYDEIKAKLCETGVFTEFECKTSNQEITEKYTFGKRSIYHTAKNNSIRLRDENGEFLNIDISFSKQDGYYSMDVATVSNVAKNTTRVNIHDPQYDYFVPDDALNEIDLFLIGSSGHPGPKYEGCVDFADTYIHIPISPPFNWAVNRIACLALHGHWVEDD